MARTSGRGSWARFGPKAPPAPRHDSAAGWPSGGALRPLCARRPEPPSATRGGGLAGAPSAAPRRTRKAIGKSRGTRQPRECVLGPRRCPHPDQMGARRLYATQEITYVMVDKLSNEKL